MADLPFRCEISNWSIMSKVQRHRTYLTVIGKFEDQSNIEIFQSINYMQKDGHVYLRVGEIFRVKNPVLRCKITCNSVHVVGTVYLLDILKYLILNSIKLV